MEIVIKGKQPLRVPLLVWCGQVYLSLNQIPGFFDHQYLWKEFIDLLNFLHGSNHRGKLASETTNFGWVWSVVPYVQSDHRILGSSISHERVN